MRKCSKKYIGKIGNKKDNGMVTDVAQLEYKNNKYYALAFRYMYRYRLIINVRAQNLETQSHLE